VAAAVGALRAPSAHFEDAGLAATAAAALLSAGEREGPKELLRLLAKAAERDALPAALLHPLLDLARVFGDWTGDDDYLARYERGLGRARLRAAAVEAGEPVVLEEAGPVRSVISGLWGITPGAPAMIQVAPAPPVSGAMALGGLRVGATTLGFRLRRTSGGVVLQVARERGPRIRLAASLRDADRLTVVTLNDEPLGGGRAVFEVSGEHEVEFRD
jgi:hypothetical protein